MTAQPLAIRVSYADADGKTQILTIRPSHWPHWHVSIEKSRGYQWCQVLRVADPYAKFPYRANLV